MIEQFEMFKKRTGDINSYSADVIYYYLFEGLALSEIEEKLFDTKEYHGWFSKTILNFYGISTHGKNRGVFPPEMFQETIQNLTNSTDLDEKRIGKILRDRYI